MKATLVFFMICKFSFLHSFLTSISCPASLNILSHQILYQTVFQFTYFDPPSSQPFYRPLSSHYFHFKFCFLFSNNLFPFHTLTISSPFRHTKPILLSRVISHPIALLLKQSRSLSTFNNLCQLVVGRVVVMSFCQGYLQSFTNSVFQISNCTGPLPYSFFHLKF